MNVLPREQSAPFGDAVEEAVLEDASGSWEPGETAVISRFPAPFVGGTAPSTCPLKNVSNTPESLESCMEQMQLHVLRNACLLHTLYLLFPLESSWCHGLRTSTEGNGSVRRAGANPTRSREFNVSET